MLEHVYAVSLTGLMATGHDFVALCLMGEFVPPLSVASQLARSSAIELSIPWAMEAVAFVADNALFARSSLACEGDSVIPSCVAALECCDAANLTHLGKSASRLAR